jgi:putative toxin-antitoxin system antitoxin component (TIGR02293 family)
MRTNTVSERRNAASPPPPPPPSPPFTTPAQEEVHLNQVAHVLETAQLVLGSEAAALTWLKAPHLALGGLAPMNVMSTDTGAAQVLRLLDKM